MSIDAVLSGAARWHIHRGEALAFLRSLPDACIDAVITDPPYSSGGAFRGDRVNPDTGSKYLGGKAAHDRANFSGDTRDQRSYLAWCALWLSECLRVTKPGAPICVFTDWRQLPTTTDAIQCGGWVWRGIVPWDKTEGVRPVLGRFRAQAEYVVFGSNGPMPMREDVGALPGAYRIPVTQADKFHQTGKPTALMQLLARICPPGGVILDPFAGSASTGAGALREGRRFVGCEMTDAYAEIARQRLSDEAAKLDGQPSLFPKDAA